MSQGVSFTKETTAQEVVDTFPDEIKDRYIVVTGASPGGLGFEVVRAIATKHPKLLVIAARDQEKLDATRESILQETPTANIVCVVIDLGSLTSVRRAAAEISSLGNVDVLINIAAVMMCPYGTTEDGFETQFGVNYVGPWMLTNLLIPSLLATPFPRVVFVSSRGHSRSDIRYDDVGFSHGASYDRLGAYGQSKTANILNAVALADQYGDRLIAISLHPGAIMTNLARYWTEEDYAPYKRFMKDGKLDLASGVWNTIPQGASTILTAAFDPRMHNFNGAYLSNNQPRAAGVPQTDPDLYLFEYAVDKDNASRLWEVTNQLTGESF